MARPRATAQSLQLSGLNKIQKTRYSTYNMEPGKVLPPDIQLKAPKKYEKQTKKAFQSITSNLIAMGALSEQDLPAMSLMMDSLNDYYKFEALIDLLDKTYMDKDDYFEKRDRLTKRKNEAMRAFYLWTGKFGITPTERTRLMCGDVSKKDRDPLDVILG